MTQHLPYKILKNEIFGRYMVAAKNIKQGELILKEKPVLIGPHLDGPLICFKCCKSLRLSHSESFRTCSVCGKAVVCKNPCNGVQHTTQECQALKTLSIPNDVFLNHSSVALPLRCILFREYNPETYEQMFQLESHLNERKNTIIWRRNKASIEKVLFDLNILTLEDIEQDLVQSICGIIDVNSFEIRSPLQTLGTPNVLFLRGIYLNAAMMAHDCLSNTHLAVDDDFTLSVHAASEIIENAPIYFNYTNALQGNVERQKHLLEGKYFKCICQRCTDPTEMGTELSSLRCHKCFKGLIRPDCTKPSEWKCYHCKHIFPEKLIDMATEEGLRRIQDVDRSSIKDMEKLLSTLLNTFHFNHYLILDLLQNMVGAYSFAPPNKQTLSRKVELCRRLLNVLDKIEPSISRNVAITKYEMSSALANLSDKQHREREINTASLLSQLQLAEKLLKESVSLLVYEPLKSPEGKITQVALVELKTLRMSIRNVEAELLMEAKSSSRKTEAVIEEIIDTKDAVVQKTRNNKQKRKSKSKNKPNL